MSRTKALGLGLLVLCLGVITIWVFLGAGSAAKRGKKPVVKPVMIAGIEYRAPNTAETHGVVEAWNPQTKKLLWCKKIYWTPRIPLTEADTQWNFIKSMTVGTATNELIIVNEDGGQYVIDTRSRKVWALKGWRLRGW